MTPSTPLTQPRFRWRRSLPFTGAAALVGVVVVVMVSAAGPLMAIEGEAGTTSGTAAVANQAGASGGKIVRFGSGAAATPAPTSTPVPTPTPTPAGACQAAIHTPGGSDGLGGCWPGAFNTGYPHGLAGDTRSPVTLTAYTGSCTINTDATVIDGKTVNCGSEGLFIYAKNVVIKNSKVIGPVYENAPTASVTVMDTEIDGGNQYTYPALGGADNVTAIRVNIHGGEHSIHCYANCQVTDSWLHDQFEAGVVPHQNGFLSNGGSVFTLRHNSVQCSASGCTGDITFIPDDNLSQATVDKNLLLAAPGASYCLYPSSNHPAKAGVVNRFTITNNVFQRGSNNKCAVYGPVYGWDEPSGTPGTDGYQNAWSGNKWTDGTLITP